MALKIIPSDTKINFIKSKILAFAFSAFLLCATIFLLATKGLNFGIDFTGGILIDAKFEQPVELSKMRDLLKGADIGDVSLQTFGEPNNILIRVGENSDIESDKIVIIDNIKEILASNFSGNIEYRNTEYVGPKVGGELIRSGALSLVLAFAAMMVYIWLRFEWQYGVGGIIALIHDAVITLGFFSLTQLEFNLSSIAAILTIIGYSINDSVVVFDRIRENLRKYKKMPMHELINVSVNNNLTRTMLTSLTTVVALLALVLMGGEVIKSFSLAALFGVIIGTYSSIYIASPVLIYMKLRPDTN
ncbi:MAG: protein translocase subunit SecF [Rickettsiales bacterium]|nr:protein translocase subunit SecF [Pseudomonadota bacterium]MDA0967026.1 protein translocase subunit SecF [Pseudomonadota bacterium]MDG4543946.1 protein translocase subunit SecF [Rickettsiales bacterium]MDG4546092.1 protein translocase subunit SecF [Rickettsiales bacterium]MDG4548338.1 protein translocase subunit SecF [Rickettsiales bacterium]